MGELAQILQAGAGCQRRTVQDLVRGMPTLGPFGQALEFHGTEEDLPPLARKRHAQNTSQLISSCSRSNGGT